ncbi:PIN domain protein [bacterium BMS3Abin04]|nr:PIN domain protein [bacterium BMS3Abin04]
MPNVNIDVRKPVTLDSSVIISYLIETEINSNLAKNIWEFVVQNEIRIILPYTILIEIVSAIGRRTQNSSLAKEVENSLLNLPLIRFIELNKSRTAKVCNSARKYGLRGMDAIIVQVSEEFKTQLITFDKEIINKLNLNYSL